MLLLIHSEQRCRKGICAVKIMLSSFCVVLAITNCIKVKLLKSMMTSKEEPGAGQNDEGLDPKQRQKSNRVKWQYIAYIDATCTYTVHTSYLIWETNSFLTLINPHPRSIHILDLKKCLKTVKLGRQSKTVFYVKQYFVY